jgi:hypothetical protein
VVQGKYAYVAASGGDSTGIIGLSLVIYDISNPTAPTAISYITTGSVVWTSGPSFLNSAYQIAVNGKYAYIFSSGSSKFYIVDVSNPYSPFNVSGLLITNSPGSLYGGAYSNGYCYIATQNKGLTVVNVTNPLSPTQTFQEGGTLNKSIGVAVNGNIVYTTNYQTTSPWTVRYLKSWNISNPASPTLISTLTLPAGTKPAEISINGHYAYVSDLNTSSVQIVNIADPSNMVYVSSMQASASFNVAEAAFFNVNISNNIYAYITSGANATYGGAIDVYNITNISSPVKVATILQNVPGSVFGAAIIVNDKIYAANYGNSGAYNSSLNIYATASVTSSPVDSRNLVEISGQVLAPASALGTLTLQGSDDATSPVNFTDIPGTATPVSGAGTYLLPKTDLCYEYVRCVYTDIGGTGLEINLKALGN